MEKAKISLGKKIMCLILVLIIVVGGGVGAYFLFFKDKSKQLTDAQAKTAILEATKTFDKTAKEMLNTQTQSSSITSNGTISNSILANDVYTCDFNDFYGIAVRFPGMYLSLVEYLVKEGSYEFGKTVYGVYGTGSEAYTLNINVIKTDDKLVKVTFIDGDFTQYCYFIDYDFKTNKLNSFNLFGANGENGISVLTNDYTKGEISLLSLGFISKTYNQFLDDFKNDLVDSTYISTYCLRVECMYGSLDIQNGYKLSRYDGYGVYEEQAIDFDSLTNPQQTLLLSQINSLVKIAPKMEEVLADIDVKNSKLSFAFIDALNYASNKYSYETALDENGNEYFITNLMDLEEYKTEINTVYSAISTEKPFYADKDFTTPTKSSVNPRLKGLFGSIKEYLAGKNENNFAGLTYATYGNYTFTYSVAKVSDDGVLNRFKDVLGYTDEIPVKQIYAKYTYQGKTSYIVVHYMLNKNGDLIYLQFKTQPKTQYDNVNNQHNLSLYIYSNIGGEIYVFNLVSEDWTTSSDFTVSAVNKINIVSYEQFVSDSTTTYSYLDVCVSDTENYEISEELGKEPSRSTLSSPMLYDSMVLSYINFNSAFEYITYEI